MESEQFITDDYWQLIKYNYDQIRHAELKASIIVSIYSIFFTVAYTIDILDEENVYSFSFDNNIIYFKIMAILPGIFFTIKSFISCISCFLPRLKLSVKPSPLFFGDIQKNWPSIENYSNELMKLMDDDEKYKALIKSLVQINTHLEIYIL